MSTFYVSLTGPLVGCYLRVQCQSETDLRTVMNACKLQRLWCSVYDTCPEVPSTIIDITPRRLALDLPWHHLHPSLEHPEDWR